MLRRSYGPEVDVYSFGIIMWELAVRKDPWSELEAPNYITQFKLLDAALRDDKRPSLPEGFATTHSTYAATMGKCWATDPTARPSFEAVMGSLSLISAAPRTVPRHTPTAEDSAESLHGSRDTRRAFATADDGWPGFTAAQDAAEASAEVQQPHGQGGAALYESEL
jgi:hypothetical protein